MSASFMSPTEMQSVVNTKKRKAVDDLSSGEKSNGVENGGLKEVVHIIQRPTQEIENLKIALQMFLELLVDEPDSTEYKKGAKETRLKIIALALQPKK